MFDLHLPSGTSSCRRAASRWATLFTAAWAAGCAAPESLPTEDAEERVGRARAAIASDPADASDYTKCGRYSYTWNGTRARISHPQGPGGCATSVDSPLVIILHAYGQPLGGEPYSYNDYEYLQTHLARNGFTSVSLDVVAADLSPAAHQAAAEEAWAFVEDFVLDEWGKSAHVDASSISLIGHSRGGDTVRYLADHIFLETGTEVKGVVQLAPATGDNLGFQGFEAVAAMQIYGMDDTDTGYASSAHNYDRGGNEGSTLDPVADPGVLYKSMKLVDGLGHTGFIDGGTAGPDLVKGYVLAFLAAHNLGDATWYEDYIRGEARPGDWAPALPIYTSYRDGFFRRVIDNFEDAPALSSTIGGVISTFQATAQVLDLGAAPATYVHDTNALYMWGSSTSSSVSFTIPGGFGDADDFEFLSMRLGQTSGAPTTDLRVAIRNGPNSWSAELRPTDYTAQLAQPSNDLCAAGCGSKRHMATIRIPLADFGAHDDVEIVQFRFKGTSIPKTFILDDLELSEWPLKP